MAGGRKRSKVKISAEIVIALVILALIAAVACYFLVPEFKDAVNRYFSRIFGDDEKPANLAKGENELRVHYLDVGQGDCIFIEFPDDTVMLIDSGDGRNTGETDTSRYIVGYLEDLGVEVIDYLMLTHSDADHAGNMVEILDAFEVEKAYVPDIDEGVIETQTYKNFAEALGRETYTAEGGGTAACEIEISQMGDLIESESETEEFFMAFLSPAPRGMSEEGEYDELNSKKPNKDSAAINAVSPITYLEYMGKRFVFTGDVIGDPAERVMQRYEAGVYDNMFKKGGSEGENYYSVDFSAGVDVYKAAHHGSRTHGSNALEFLQFLRPEYAICCVQEGEYNDMPASALLTDLAELGTTLYRTDENGTVVVTVYPETGKELSFYLTRQDQTVGGDAVAEGAAYFVSRRKIMVNCVFAEAIA